MILIQFLNGLSSAMLLFILASGLTLIFGVLGVVNFAHGSLYMLGAYFTYSLVQYFGNYWVSLIVAPLLVALIAGLIEVFCLRRLYAREHEFQLLLLYSFILILDDLVKALWGSELKLVPRPEILDGSVQIAGMTFPLYTLFIIVLGLLVSLILWCSLNMTRIGKQVVAASLDRDAANALGMNVPFLYTVVFMFGSFLGGVGGTVAAPLRAATPCMGMEIIIMSFAVVIIGGLGSVWGAFLGALLIGEVLAFGTLFAPNMVALLPFVLMILVFLWRPQGLLGKGGN
jgi:branched-subunit amino acid ABC-type transport system permease component